MKLLIILISLVAVAYAAYRIFLKKEPIAKKPDAEYVCDVCGEQDCQCHKKEDEHHSH